MWLLGWLVLGRKMAVKCINREIMTATGMKINAYMNETVLSEIILKRHLYC